MKLSLCLLICRARLSALLTLGLLSSLPVFGAAENTVFLRVDFNHNNAGIVSPTQSGYQSFDTLDPLVASSASYPVTDLEAAPSGSVTVKLSSGTQSTSNGPAVAVNRANPSNSGAFTFGPLYQDFVKDPASSGLWLRISGLRGDYQYNLTFYCYDYGIAGTSTVAIANKQAAGTTGGSSSITYTGGTTPTGNAQYATTVTVTTKPDGTLLYQLTSTGANTSAVLNGLIIAQGPAIYASYQTYPGRPTHIDTDQAIYWISEDTGPNETVLVAGGFSSAAKTIRLASLAGATSAATALSTSTLTVPGTLMSSTGLTFVHPDPTLLPPGPFGFRIEDSAGLQLVGRGNLPTIRWTQGIWSTLTSTVAPLHPLLFNAVEQGGVLRIFGRDFPATAYVRLTATGGAYTTIPVTALNRYALSVPISAGQATGTYTVQVGAGPALDATYGDPCTITVQAPSVLTASTQAITGLVAGTADNAATIQNFLLANPAGANQIKIFTLPTGNYTIASGIVLGVRQYLQGMGMTATKITGTATTPPDAWISGSSYWGLLDLTVEAAQKKYIVQSDSSFGGHVTLNNITVTSVIPITGTTGTRRAVYLRGPELFLCNSIVSGLKEIDLFFEKAVTAYVYNTRVNLGEGGVVYFENCNNMVFDHGFVVGSAPNASSGFSLSRTKTKGATCDNVYIADTEISHIYGNNSEAITQDGGGGAYVGRMQSMPSTTRMTLQYDPDWYTLNAVAGQGVVTIISGRGQGQSRTLVGGTGRDIDIDTPWIIAPNLDSVFTISGGQRNLIFYHNTMIDVRPAVQLFGTAIDATIADNYAQNCAGIVVRSRMQGAILPILNVDIVNNVLDGNAPPYNSEGLPKVNTDGIHLLCSTDGFLSNVLMRYNTYPAPGDLSFEQQGTGSRTTNVFAEGNLGTTRAQSLIDIAPNPTIKLRNNLVVDDTFTAGFGGTTAVYPRWRTGAGTDIAYSTTAVPDALQVTPSGSTTPDRLILRPFTTTTLGVGDTIRLTVDFYSVSGSGQFRFGLYNINGTITDGSAYGSSSPQTLKDGYFTFFSVATTGTASPIRREHEAGISNGTPNANSFTVTAQTATGTSGSATYITELTSGTANVDFRGAANKVQAVFTITKNSAGNNTLTAQLYKGGVLTGYNLTATESDGLGYSAFNAIAFMMPAATVYDNVRVEFIDVP